MHYNRITPADVPEIVEEHLLKGRIVEHLLHKPHGDEELVTTLNEINFYKSRRVLHCATAVLSIPKD